MKDDGRLVSLIDKIVTALLTPMGIFFTGAITLGFVMIWQLSSRQFEWVKFNAVYLIIMCLFYIFGWRRVQKK